MPSFYNCKKYYGEDLTGEERNKNARMIIEETWWDDTQSQVAYLYDWTHDNHVNQLRNLDPKNDTHKTPIDIKYIVNSSQTFAKDIITYHIQLRPSQKCNVSYYEELFADRYNANFPNGLYCDIKDASGQYNRWLVVAGADYYDPQFPTFEILPCDYVFQWIMNRTKYQVAGALRSQNSYNSGIWTNNKETSVEDQQKCIIPLNRETEKIYYGERFLIDAPVLSEPRAWQVSKVNRISVSGLINITFAQEKFNQYTDYIEVDETGKVIGLWADYYDKPVLPAESSEDMVSNISYSGVTPELKVRGGYKKFTVTFDSEDIEVDSSGWSFMLNGEDASSLVTIIKPEDSTDLESNQIKVKFTGSEEYLGEILTVKYTTASGIVSSLDVSIISL